MYLKKKKFFFPFYHHKNTKIKSSKSEKICWRYHHFTHVHQKSQSYDCTVPEIRCKTGRIFLWFWAIFCPISCLTTPKIKILKLKKTPGYIIILHICTINDNHMMYGSRDMERNRQNFLSFWTIFCSFASMDQEDQNVGKMNNTPEDIIILQMCTTNDSHMMYGSWDMKCNRQNSLSFWTVFCPFTPLTTWKIKICKNWKIYLELLPFYMCIINDNQMMYGSWDNERDRQIFLLFWTSFCTFASLTTQNIKILKIFKNAWRYYHFTQVYHKLQSYDVWFLRYRAW